LKRLLKSSEKSSSVDERIVDILLKLRTEKNGRGKRFIILEHYLDNGPAWSSNGLKNTRQWITEVALYPIYHQKQDYIQYFFNQPLISPKPEKCFEIQIVGLSYDMGSYFAKKNSNGT